MWRLALVVSLILPACWGAPRPVAPSRDTKLVLAVEQVELANGLKLVVVPEPTAHEVSVTVRYGAGNVDDPPGREGLAHLVEHVMFEHERDGEALFDFLERSALGFTGFTTPDSTVYREHAPPALLKEMLALEQARMQQACADIPEASFVRQREIVRNELREREDETRVAHALHAGVYGTPHPLGRSPATAQTVAALTREDVCAFVAAHYAPNNAVVVVSGAVHPREVKAAVEQTLGLVSRGTAPSPRPLGAAGAGRSATLEAPTDRAWFVLAWPMPAPSIARTRLRAVATMAADLVSGRVNGQVTLTELGSGAARAIAIAVAPSPDISLTEAIERTKTVISEIQPWFGSGLYEHAKYRAVHALAASFEHGGQRDVRFADDVARGDRVRPGEEARALLAMSREEAHDLLRSMLRPDKAALVTLRPSTRAATSASGIVPTFREHRRRRAEDPREAERPAAALAPTAPAARARSRTLANGLTVVLLPFSTTPTIDIRLILPTGTGDEIAELRGISLVAAHALEPVFGTEMFRFFQAGGRVDADVGLDHTELAVRGLAANLDTLLSGLAITVQEGAYTLDGIYAAKTWLQAASRTDRDGRIATAVWREAIYGADHPYRHAGDLTRGALAMKALERFRALHYRPRGATLILAGQFDAHTADRWVDYYFKDWVGDPPRRRDHRAALRPLAFAQKQGGSQLSVHIAFAAPTSDEAALRVVVEMLEGAIADVREQLAASYGLHARVVQRRSSTTVELGGFVDAARAGEAFSVLRDRLARLRERNDETASLFVSARRRVVARWASLATTASTIADVASDDAALGRAPGSRSAIRAGALTIDQVQPLLGKLELANAAMLLRGPERALRDAYAAVGRQPSFL